MVFRASAFALVALIACGDDKASIDAPRLGTEWVLIAAAGGGRPLAPTDIRVERAADIQSLEIPGTGNVEVDMIYGGLDEADLPQGLTPETLSFVSRRTANTRAFPPLVLPHVLLAPSPPGSDTQLVPIEESAISEEERDYRRERFQALIKDVGVVDPCETTDLEFHTPRIPATAVNVIKVVANGDAYFGLTASSTAIVGLLRAGESEMELIGVDTGSSAIESGEVAAILDLGDRDVTGREGAPIPENFSLHRGSVLPHVGTWSASARKYLDETPRALDPGPGMIRWLRHADIDGEEKLCMAGSASGQGMIGSGARIGGAWCRDASGGPWEIYASIMGAQSLRALIDRPSWPLLAIDYSGTVHARSNDGDWRDVLTPGVNQTCGAVACVRIDEPAIRNDPSSDVVAVVAGEKGQVIVIRGSSATSLIAEPLAAVSASLFADERAAINFDVAAYTPDGALWLGSDLRLLVRVSPDLSNAARLFLPSTASDAPVTAIGAAPDGRLIVATTPPVVGVGTWRRP